MPHTLSNRPIVLPDSTEIAIELVGGRDISANFDMQSLTSLLHGDRILVRRPSTACAFCTPGAGITLTTLRKKLRWNDGGSWSMALLRMALRDFVIVQQRHRPARRLPPLTGETGAGKSILIDALQLALGARADTSVVREGRARPTSTPNLTSPRNSRTGWSTAALKAAPACCCAASSTRRARAAPGSTAARPLPTIATAPPGAQLVDIHGQHAWQSLTQPTPCAACRCLRPAARRRPAPGLDAVAQRPARAGPGAHAAKTALRERERLLWQIGECKNSPPGPQGSGTNCRHSTPACRTPTPCKTAPPRCWLCSKAKAWARAAAWRAGAAAAHQQAHLEPRFEPVAQELASSLAQVEDARHALQLPAPHRPRPQHLQALDERLAAWLAQARRYKCPPAELPQLLLSWQQNCNGWTPQPTSARCWRKSSSARAATTPGAAAQCAAPQRRAPAGPGHQCRHAGFGHDRGTFDVRISPPRPGPQGLDAVEFLVASHPGVTPRPVGKVASAASCRALPWPFTCTSELGQAGTLIFDEVDAGIGGAVAQTVGQLMQRLGRDRQVLAVTHLAQVAACADQHLVVHKQRSTQGTSSSVTP